MNIQRHPRLIIQLLGFVCLLIVFAIGSSFAKPERPKGAQEKKPIPTKVAPVKPRSQPPAQTPTNPPQEKPQAQPENTVQPPLNTPVQIEQPVSEATTSMTGEQIKWQVLSAGGVSSSSASYKLNGTIGQTATGITSSPSYAVSQGFWYSGSSGCCVGIRGDANGNGTVNVLDLNFLVAYFFAGGPAPSCMDEANVNGTGGLNVLDLNYLVAYFFAGGPPPTACP